MGSHLKYSVVFLQVLGDSLDGKFPLSIFSALVVASLTVAFFFAANAYTMGEDPGSLRDCAPITSQVVLVQCLAATCSSAVFQ